MLAWYHLLWLLTIAALAILFAIGLAAAAPRDWSPTHRLSLALTYLVTCFLLLGCYSLGNLKGTTGTGAGFFKNQGDILAFAQSVGNAGFLLGFQICRQVD